jgi:Uma2 family endonuclease
MNAIRQPEPVSLYGQLLALPENVTGEIIDGVLYTQPRPTGPHVNAELGLGSALRIPFHKGQGGPGGWWIVAEPELHFIRDVLTPVPDLAGWRRERMTELPKDHRFEIVPDWVCEILSPSTAKKDRTKKLPMYARYGVAYVWLIDPLEQTLEAFRLEQGHWVLLATLADDEPVSVPPFDAITFSLADLWG